MKPLSPRRSLLLPPEPDSGGQLGTPAGGEGKRVRDSAELFGRDRELLIEHAGCVYRLRITQHNKLILTK